MMIKCTEQITDTQNSFDLQISKLDPRGIELKINIPHKTSINFVTKHRGLINYFLTGKNPESNSLDNNNLGLNPSEFVSQIRNTQKDIKQYLNFNPKWYNPNPDEQSGKDLMSSTYRTLSSVEQILTTSAHTAEQNEQKTLEIINQYRLYCLLAAVSGSLITYAAVSH
jgi:hypothetical protein